MGRWSVTQKRISNNDVDVNENGKKAIGLDWQNNNFAPASRFFFSLPSLHDYDVKMPNFTFFGGREHKTTTFFFFSRPLMQYFRIQLQKHLPTFDEMNEMERDGISAIKFEAARLHFLSDVFVAVVVVVA